MAVTIYARNIHDDTLQRCMLDAISIKQATSLRASLVYAAPPRVCRRRSGTNTEYDHNS